MKKKFKLLFSMLAVLALAFSLAACSPTTLEDYLNESSNTAQLQEIANQQSTDEIQVSFHADGNKLVFEGRFKIAVDDSIKSALEEVLDGDDVKQTYESIAKEFRDELHINDITVGVVYKDINGTVLAQREYNPS